MKKSDKLKNKAFVFIISSALTGLVILLFFLDDSLGWNYFKTISCIIVSLWVFFIVPAVRNSYLLNEDKPLSEWFRMGFEFGVSGIAFPILLAPYYGARYYFSL